MVLCCKNESSVINSIYSRQQLFSYTNIKKFDQHKRATLIQCNCNNYSLSEGEQHHTNYSLTL